MKSERLTIYPEDGGSRFLRKVPTFLPVVMLSDILQDSIFGHWCEVHENVIYASTSHIGRDSRKLEVCHPRCVCENWTGYLVKHNYVN